MKLIFSTLLFLCVNTHASSFITCDLNVTVLVNGPKLTKFKVNKVVQGKSGFGDCNISKGQTFEVKVAGAEKLTSGSSTIINYNNYSAMGENGPVGGTTWTVK